VAAWADHPVLPSGESPFVPMVAGVCGPSRSYRGGGGRDSGENGQQWPTTVNMAVWRLFAWRAHLGLGSRRYVLSGGPKARAPVPRRTGSRTAGGRGEQASGSPKRGQPKREAGGRCGGCFLPDVAALGVRRARYGSRKASVVGRRQAVAGDARQFVRARFRRRRMGMAQGPVHRGQSKPSNDDLDRSRGRSRFP
jgi:hypothetical protein